MAPKRTYSQRNMNYEQRKHDSHSAERGSMGSTSSKRSKTSEASYSPHAKAKFSGPVSFHVDDDDDTSGIRLTPTPTTISHKSNQCRRLPHDALNLHGGGLAAFKSFCATPNANPSNHGHSDHTASSTDKSTRSVAPSVNGASAILAESLNKWSKSVKPRAPHTPRQYQATLKDLPCRNVLKRDLAPESREGILWKENQINSHFLRLPAEIRNTIYEYVFGGSTILVGFETYRATWIEVGIRQRIIPVFKYFRSIFPERCNPLKNHSMTPYSGDSPSTTAGLFNLALVSRQLYEETAPLPYRLSRWAFDSHNTMFNFVVMERKLRGYQRNAMTELYVCEVLPQACTLALLEGLEKVYLVPGRQQLTGFPRSGWYTVKRDGGNEPRLVKSAVGFS